MAAQFNIASGIGLACLFLALVFTIIAISAPYWAEYEAGTITQDTGLCNFFYCVTTSLRMRDTCHIKVPIGKGDLRHMESLPTSLHYTAVQF